MHVWAVSQDNAGTMTQALGVARRLNPEPHRIALQARLRFWEAGPFFPYRNLKAPSPDIVVSCGSMAEQHVFAIADRSRRRPLTVHLQPPTPKFVARYDLIFICRHDWREEHAAPNTHQMIGVPHQVRREDLVARRVLARQRLRVDNVPVAVMLVGGPNRAYEFDASTAGKIIDLARSLVQDGWGVLLSASRRSPARIRERLLEVNDERLIVWDGRGDNPYLDFLAAADALLVTKDSITMTCEALTTGKPVFVFGLPPRSSPQLQKFERFHEDMSQTLGLTRAFTGNLDPYAYNVPDETGRVARIVTEHFAAARGTRG